MHGDRASRIKLGKYVPQQFVAELAQGRGFAEGHLTEIPLFVHEYWHYLQNVSTNPGVRGFALKQVLLDLFSRTFRSVEEGYSLGCGVLSDAEREAFSIVTENLGLLEGELSPPGRMEGAPVTSRVLGLADGKLSVEIIKQGRVVETSQFKLGSAVIEESVADLVERAFAMAIGVESPLSPEFPYRVLERIVEWAMGSRDEPGLVSAALGTLALLHRRPDLALSRLVAAYRRLRVEAKLDPFAAVRAVASAQSSAVRAELEGAIPQLSELEQMHSGRGMSEKAALHVCAEIRKGLTRRVADPLFDLEPLFQGLSKEEALGFLASLVTDHVPCDFLLRASAGDGAEIVTFSPSDVDELGHDLSQYLRSFQAQLHFMQAHRRPDRFVPTAELRARCPFFSACKHPLKVESSEKCSVSPWEHTSSKTPGCWYTNGVNATRGKVKLLRAPG